MKEKLQEYALVAEIISAIAVVAGLIFVGLQIQQSTEEVTLNTRAIEVSAYQDLIGQIMGINTILMENPEIVEIVFKAERGEELDPVEDRMFSNYLMVLFRHADMACYQYQQGLISGQRLGSAFNIFIDLVYPNFMALPLLQQAIGTSPGFAACLNLAVDQVQSAITASAPG